MNTYLISSFSYHLLAEEIKKITKDDSNIVNYDLDEDELSDILEDASYVSLFDEKKYIVVNNANIFSSEKISEEITNKILKYLENNNPNIILIFTLSKPLGEAKPLVKEFRKKATVIVIEPFTTRDLITRINEILKENEKKMSMLSINYIIDSCQLNYDAILNELTKMFIYLDNKDQISDDEVKKIVSKYSETNNFKFGDAVVDKNIVQAFNLLEELQINNVDPLMLIGLLASKYRTLLGVNLLMQENKNDTEIASELGVKPYPVKLARNKSFMYTISDLEDNLVFLSELDVKIKMGTLEGYKALEMFILTIGEV